MDVYFNHLKPLHLEDYQKKFVSHDLDETRRYIASAIRPHSLSILGRNQNLDAKIGKTDFGDISFLYIKHGANVSVSLGDL